MLEIFWRTLNLVAGKVVQKPCYDHLNVSGFFSHKTLKVFCARKPHRNELFNRRSEERLRCARGRWCGLSILGLRPKIHGLCHRRARGSGSVRGTVRCAFYREVNPEAMAEPFVTRLGSHHAPVANVASGDIRCSNVDGKFRLFACVDARDFDAFFRCAKRGASNAYHARTFWPCDCTVIFNLPRLYEGHAGSYE